MPFYKNNLEGDVEQDLKGLRVSATGCKSLRTLVFWGMKLGVNTVPVKIKCVCPVMGHAEENSLEEKKNTVELQQECDLNSKAEKL